MRNKGLAILALTILVTSTFVGCSGASPTDSTLTIFSITEGDVFVMKAGADDWTEATVEMPLGVGDTIKTGDDSGAEITFFDGSTIELEARTQIEITSLDSSPDTGATTITLMQTIGTTISRVTKLLDPASTYAIETPSGVAAVRGSIMIVQIIFNDPNYEDFTTWIINQKGSIWAIAEGVELQIPEGRTCVIRPDRLPQLIPLNHPPVAASDSAITDADSWLTVDAPGVLSNDSDPDGDTLFVTALNTSGTVGTLIAWDADGSFTYDPNGQFQYLPAGNSTSDSFTYTVSDDSGGTDTATVTVTIDGVYEPLSYYPPAYYPPVNYPPAAADDAATTDEDSWVSAAAPGVLSNDSDPDAGDTLSVTAVDTSGTSGAVTWSADGSFAYDPSGQFDYLSAGNSTTDVFTYTVSDGHGGRDVATVTITINGVNDTPGNNPPMAVNDSYITDEDTPITVDAPGVLINDSDPDEDVLAVTAVDTSGTSGAVTWSADGSFAYDPSGQFDYLSAGNSTTDVFTYTVSDGHGGRDVATVTITINGVNDPVETFATVGVTIDKGTGVSIFIWDNTIGAWAMDKDTDLPVNGQHHVASAQITVAGEHSYCVYVGAPNVTYNVGNSHGWVVSSAPIGGQQACGFAAADSNTPLHFTEH